MRIKPLLFVFVSSSSHQLALPAKAVQVYDFSPPELRNINRVFFSLFFNCDSSCSLRSTSHIGEFQKFASLKFIMHVSLLHFICRLVVRDHTREFFFY